MKKQYWARLLFSTCMILCMATASGQSQDQPDIVSSTAPFLRIPADARSGGMGNMGLATRPDANSSLWNAAKTPFGDSIGALAVNYNPWLRNITEDMYLLHAGGYYKLNDVQAISANIRYFSLGQLNIMDHTGQVLRTTYPRETAIDVAYARKLSGRLGIGATFRFISSNLMRGAVGSVHYKAATAVAGDISLFYNGVNDAGKGLTAGLTVSNLGSRPSYSDSGRKEFLPANLGLGLAYTFAMEEDHRLMLGAEANKLMVPVNLSSDDYNNTGTMESWFKSFGHNTWCISGGMEYSYRNLFFARAGYVAGSRQTGKVQELTCGLGLRYLRGGLNISYTVPTGNGEDRNPLSNMLRIGLTIDLSPQQ